MGIRSFLIECFKVGLRVYYRPRFKYIDPSVQTKEFKTPSVIISNHTSHTNALVLMACLKGPNTALVARDWYEKKQWTKWLDTAETIPCDRHGLDTEWLRKSQEAIKNGKSVIIFPEGHTRKDGNLDEFKSGFAMLAAMTGAPVVPLSICNRYSFAHPPQIVIGMPEYLDRRKMLDSDYLVRMSEDYRTLVSENRKFFTKGK